jgi:WD40 repeat protein
MRAYLRAAVSQVWRRRALTLAVPVLAVIALVVGGLAFQAVSEADRANAARAEADALRIAGEARAAFASRPDLGLLLAMEAAARSDDLQLGGMPLVGLTQGPGPRRFEDVGQPVEEAALDGIGARAVLRARDGIVLWDVESGQTLATIPGSRAIVAMSGDGSTFALGEASGVAIHAWPSAQARTTCPITGGAITGLALSETGDRLVVIADRVDDLSQSQVAVLRTADCSATPLTGVNGRIGPVDIDEAGDRVALGSNEDGAGVWQISTGLPFGGLRPGDDIVRSVAFGADENLAAGSANGELLLWDLTEPEQEARRIRVHGTEGVTAVASSTHDLSEILVSGASDGHLAIIRPYSEPPTGPPLQALPPLDHTGGSVHALDIAVTGTKAVTVDPSGRVITWDLEGHPPLGPRFAADHFIDMVAPLPDGSVIAADRNGLYLLDGRDGRVAWQIADATVVALGAGPSGWAAASFTGDVLVPSDTPDGVRSIARVADQDPVALAALPDGGWAVAFEDISKGGTVVVVRGTGERQDLAMTARPSAIVSEGRWLFVGDMTGTVHVFDAADLARPERVVEAHAFDIGSMALSPDGSTLATGSDDRAIALWNVADDGTLTERVRLSGHEERVTSLTFSPDGHWLASAGEEPAVLLWNLDVGQRVGDPIPVHLNTVVAFALDADRQLLVANIRLDRWDMRVEQWPVIACRIVGSRRLGPVEQDRFLRGEAPVASCP